jgi:DNA polymerase-3 subunit gamma/tau
MALLRMLAFRPAGSAAGTGGGSAAVSTTRLAQRPPSSPVPSVSDNKGQQRKPRAAQSAPQRPPQPTTVAPDKVSVEDIHNWPDFAAGLSLDGAARELAAHSALGTYSPFEIRLSVEGRNEHLLTDKLKSRLTAAIQQRIGSGIAVQFSVTDQALETAAARAVDHSEQAMRRAQDAIENDPDVQQLVDVLGGEIVANSVQPIDCETSPGQDQDRTRPEQGQ